MSVFLYQVVGLGEYIYTLNNNIPIMTNKTLVERMSEIFGGDEEEYEPDTEANKEEPEFEGEGAEKDELPFDPQPE